jgi:replicative DNA helicase
MSELIDIEAERKLIGQFLTGTSNQYWNDVDLILEAEAFSDGECHEVYCAIKRVADNATSGIGGINAMSVYAELKKLNSEIEIERLIDWSLKDIGEPIEIAKYLHELYIRRSLIESMTKSIYKLNDLSNDVAEGLEDIRATVEDVTKKMDDNVVSIQDLMKDILKKSEDRMNGKLGVGTPVGIDIIDETGGFHLTDLNVIAGDSSMGKTSFALLCMLNSAKQGIPVAIYSLEMSMSQIAARLIAIDNQGLTSNRLQYYQLSNDEFGLLYKTACGLMTLPVYFDKSANCQLDKIISSIRILHYRYGIKGVMIDYVQLINTKKSKDRVEELALITRSLKNIAKELNIFVVLLSQLNRPATGISPVPTMKRLRGSGEIEEAADNIYMIYRAEVYEKKFPGGWANYDTKGTALLIRAKGRNVGTGERLMRFDAEHTTFSNYSGTSDSIVDINSVPNEANVPY